MDLIKAAKYFIETYVTMSFYEGLKTEIVNDQVTGPLETLYKNYGLFQIFDDLPSFY